ncbi:MAG TPA: hypothetical protein VGN08_14285 [Solirubrobacteraceae bacterium]
MISDGRHQAPGATLGDRSCVAQCLYLHEEGEQFYYPSSRSTGSAARLGARYLECALVQAASLRWLAPDCELLLATNLAKRDSLSRRGRALLDRIISLGVTLVPAEYRHAPREATSEFHSSRYVFDAIEAISAGRNPDGQLWIVDVDCVWLDPQAAFETVAARTGVSALEIPYPPDWEGSGYNREAIGALGTRLGACDPAPPWIGGEALAGTVGELRGLMEVCERLDEELAGIDVSLPTEEQLLTLAGGLRRVRFHNLSTVVGRIWTGRRHGAANPSDPAALAIWHLPSEKGLSFRRAANALLRGSETRLRRDLSSRELAGGRFNVSSPRWSRSLRDDSWIAASKVRDTLVRGG